MSSNNKGAWRSSNSLAKQKAISETSTVDGINVGVGDLGFNSDQNDGWVVCARKSKNKGGSSSLGKKPWIPQNPISESWGKKNSTWGHPDIVRKLGFRNNVG
ncbi:hypothetical protein RND71_023491 [Anisodus tanguticus]|uniref:Uncharacterized protein n=1 Tax=Anisodus tanguticus TaxID=243964 RepID=A0AAE1VBM4_9SOLA|nr:hypothetical protein RND71_023491 [Anisodus tanguticus]